MRGSHENGWVVRIGGLAAGTAFTTVAILAVLAALHPSSGLRDLFAVACHQHPARSHGVGGEPLGLCVRCFWLYVGLAVGHLRFVAWTWVPSWRRAFLLATGVFAGVDWLAGWLPFMPDLVALRALTGFLFGLAITHYSLPGLVEWITGHSVQPPTTVTAHESC